MKTLKKILISLLVIIAILVVIAYMLPKNVHVERSLAINAPAKVIYSQINDLHLWSDWSPWSKIDTAMVVEYENNGIGKDAAYTWTSQHPQVGNGKLTITEAIPYDSIVTLMDFMKQGTTSGYFTFKEGESGTNVVWGFDTDLGMNPVARWMGLMFDQMLGKDFEDGLASLKEISEKIVSEKLPVVDVVELQETIYVGTRKKVSWEKIGEEMGTMYGMISSYIQKNNLTITGAPFAVYHEISDGMIDLEAGIPVAETADAKRNVYCGTLAGGKFAHADHWGDYNRLGETHAFVQQWVELHGFELSGSPFEQYPTDPMSEPDTSKWLTLVYYPIN